ncbi:MAG: hypothetical protein CMP55_01660 [Flavobacteriales bacterium]|nr:hypothetical protein [Flavobacteriales bacterium]|tara:strand:+ start:1459 stop:2538 length:1080 start_codon:yes stop_codon:yes gene_type:complete
MRIEQLTFTRFIAAISIVIFHYGKDIPPFNYLSFLFQQANIGVSYFFILSGFVMIIAYHNKEKVEFLPYMQKRFARIYPITFLAAIILLCFKIFELFIYPENSDLSIVDFLLGISLQQAWFPSKAMSFNTPAWSITVEWFFYLCFPFIFNRFYKRPNISFIIAAALIIWLISQYILHYLLDSSFYNGFPSPSHSLIHYFPLLHLNEFLIGNVTGLLFIKYLRKIKKSNDLMLIGLLILTIIILKYNTALSFHNGLLMVVFVPLILLISCSKGLIYKFFNKKSLVYLGNISFGIYILQKPIFMLFKGIFDLLNWRQPELQFYISLVFLLMLSFLSFRYFESPMRRKISKLKPFKKQELKT